MKNVIKLGKILSRDEMKNVFGGNGSNPYLCGNRYCSHYQACCTRDDGSGGTVYYCTTTACLEN
jgi:hypothetical protein